MLHLICGPDRLENSQRLIAKLCERAGGGIDGQILIVPEQYSHETERALLAAGGDRISAYAEVLSFTRLSSRVFSLYGGVSYEYLDEGGRMLCFYLAAQNVMQELKYYAGAVTRPDFLKQLGAMLEELMNSCLSPQAVLDCAQRVEGQLSQKLRELGLLYESYLSVCKNGRQDPVTKLLRLSEVLKEQPYADGKQFYLDGFSDFTGVQMEILSTLMQSADDVFLALTTDGSKSSAFSCANETLHRVKQAANRLNVPFDVEMSGIFAPRSEPLSHLQKHLFSGTLTPFERKTEQLRFLSALSGADECRFAAKTVRELAANGERFRDIAIAVTDEAYLPQLKSLLLRARIPAYYAGNEDILQQPLFAAVLCAVQAADRFEYEDVLQFLKSAWSPLEKDTVDCMEQYAHLWSVRGKRWRTPWTMHPRGFGESWEEADRVLIMQLEAWRAASVSPLERLHAALHGGENVSTQILALSNFLEEIELSKTLEEQTKEYLSQGMLQSAQRNAQLYETLIGALEQMYRILGGCRMDAQQFLQILKLLLGCYQVGTIPACVDEVQVGPVMSMRHSVVRNLIVLGAEDGKLPEFSLQSGLLSDTERQTLLSMGLQLAPAREQALERELGWSFAAISGATQMLIFVRSDEQPAWLCTKIRQVFPSCREEKTRRVTFLPDMTAAASKIVSLSQQKEAWITETLLKKAQELEEKSRYEFLPLKMQTVHGLYGNPLFLSASRIDQFASCRFAFFMNYGLKAKPWKKAELDAPIFGTFVHYVLECTVREVSRMGGFAQTDDALLMKIASRHTQDYINRFLPDLNERGQRFFYLFERNLTEVSQIVLDVGRELRQARFVPADEELSFDREGELPPVKIEGKYGAGLLSGKVDRVDVYQKDGKTYFRIIDYKTGHRDFDYADILLGEGLQMLLYLFALQKSGEARYGASPEPAGVLYVPGRSSVLHVESGAEFLEAEKLRKKESRRKGLVLDDPALLRAMEDSDTPEYLPVQIRKGEAVGDLATKEQFEQLSGFVTERVSQMTDDMLCGSVKPNPIIRGPLVSSCRYCDYRQTCHQDFCPQDKRYIRAVKAEQFWDEVERRRQIEQRKAD